MSDVSDGRNNDTAGSVRAQNYLLGYLGVSAVGANSAGTGEDAYQQAFTGGTNVLGLIKGKDLPNEYVIVGGHYDHLGNSCRNVSAADNICNGATDNAAGAAAALEVGRALATIPGGPHRSVIVALWDREEDGLLGSQYYTQHPLVPNANVVAYVNFDIQGSNLLPSLRTSSFAVGAETGGTRLTQAVQTAVGTTLDTHLVSSIFGQGRSDYVNFTAVGIPNVFFSDSTGPCYHTVDDEVGVVDWGKLDKQVAILQRVMTTLASTNVRPTFVSGSPLATYADAIVLRDAIDALQADLATFPAAAANLVTYRSQLDQIVAAGPVAFDNTAMGQLLSISPATVGYFTHGPCNGFLATP